MTHISWSYIVKNKLKRKYSKNKFWRYCARGEEVRGDAAAVRYITQERVGGIRKGKEPSTVQSSHRSYSPLGREPSAVAQQRLPIQRDLPSVWYGSKGTNW